MKYEKTSIIIAACAGASGFLASAWNTECKSRRKQRTYDQRGERGGASWVYCYSERRHQEQPWHLGGNADAVLWRRLNADGCGLS